MNPPAYFRKVKELWSAIIFFKNKGVLNKLLVATIDL
jgi:hypothetical protein